MPRYAMKYTSSTQGQQHVCHAKPLFDNVLRSVAERLAPQCSKDRITVGVNIINVFCQAIDTSCTQRGYVHIYIYIFICCKSTTVSYTCKYQPILSRTCELAQLPPSTDMCLQFCFVILFFSTPCLIYPSTHQT